MNKTHYRLVFNKLRGMLMAVAEHVASTGKSTRETKANGEVCTLEAAKKVKQMLYKQKLLAVTVQIQKQQQSVTLIVLPR
jgi:hypothetical protein